MPSLPSNPHTTLCSLHLGALAMSDQSALDVLASHGVTCLLSSHGQVPLSSLENRSVCILFSANWCRPCRTFVPQLARLYETVNAAGEHPLEILFVSSDHDEKAFDEHFRCMPWLAVPFDASLHGRLNKHYRVHRIPSLVPLTSEEMPGHDELIGMIEDYGAEAFPFTKKRLEELKLLDASRREGGNLERLLAGEGRDCLLLSDGGAGRLPVPHLVGKTVGLYFGASWSPPCSDFTQQLKEAYAELKAAARDQCFEVIFVSTDGNKEEFEAGTSSMPWPFIPYEDKSRKDLCRIFGIRRIPALIIVGRDGRTASREGREMVSEYGAMGFPFTAERRREIEEALREEGEKLGRREVKDARHEHALKPGMAKAYVCDSCKREGRFWALSCEDCNYDLHPTCLN
ncbi:probable nucleoredoxin 3 [Eucalyptus grandis]|uniref:protein-disulfide reductase n=1 Tax=Eucalyptus globulus TaxID=34317 RepID=A0ABD3LDP8_EUCGL|nr:probable nucleoredoxin 3 [Eucalyptus grandis]